MRYQKMVSGNRPNFKCSFVRKNKNFRVIYTLITSTTMNNSCNFEKWDLKCVLKCDLKCDLKCVPPPIILSKR